MRLTRDLRGQGRDDRGSALMAVLGVMAVTMVIGLTITAATINGLSTTSSSRASVQSRSAAEAGIDSGLVAVSSGSCPTASSGSAVVTYSATIQYLDAGGNAVTCLSPLAVQMRIISTGTAQSVAVAGATQGNTSKIEAVYGYTPFTPATPGTPGTPASAPPIVASGAAMYLYGGLDLKNISPIASTGAVTGIQVKSGDLDCNNNTTISGDVVVANGDLSLKKCIITGNVWVSGTATMATNSEIRGNLRAANASRPSLVTGSYNAPATAPTVPDWVDFGYEPTKWLNSDGSAYTVKNLGGCNITSASAVNLTAPTKPLILNALGCSTVTASADVMLVNDLVIFAHGFDFTGKANGLTFGSLTARKLWFVTPDGNAAVVADKKPSCSGQGDFLVKNGFTIGSTVSAMLYTPCSLGTGNRPTWVGQLYVGEPSSTWNDIDFDYAGVGLAGVNLSDGTVTAGPTAATPGTPGTAAIPAKVNELASHRDLAG